MEPEVTGHELTGHDGLGRHLEDISVDSGDTVFESLWVRHFASFVGRYKNQQAITVLTLRSSILTVKIKLSACDLFLRHSAVRDLGWMGSSALGIRRTTWGSRMADDQSD